jgi:hypothetical protein
MSLCDATASARAQGVPQKEAKDEAPTPKEGTSINNDYTTWRMTLKPTDEATDKAHVAKSINAVIILFLVVTGSA